jgi:hypothetical protein
MKSAIEVKKEMREKLRELFQDMKAVHCGGHGADFSEDYKKGWYDAISLIEDRMLEEKT